MRVKHQKRNARRCTAIQPVRTQDHCELPGARTLWIGALTLAGNRAAGGRLVRLDHEPRQSDLLVRRNPWSG
jgi:hypothetical protein